MLKVVFVRVLALLALTCLAACNTYSDSLLTRSLEPSVPAGGTSGVSGGGGGGESNGAAANGEAGEAGADSEDGMGGVSGHAGAPSAEAGSSGNAGNAGLGGSSGVSGGAGRAGGGGTAGMPAAGSGGGPSGAEIDDFEDQDEFILRLNMRNGPWYVFSDGTPTGTLGKLTIAPLAGADVRPSSSSSTAALHLTAMGFTDWGAGVGADMVNLSSGKKAPYDVSAYRGIRFYAKIASGSTATVKVLFPNIYSDADGGKCDDTVSTKRCGDHLFKSVSGLKTTWDVYEVKFSELTQQPFGLPQAKFDPTGVYSVQFTLANKLAVDIWLDDVTFVLN